MTRKPNALMATVAALLLAGAATAAPTRTWIASTEGELSQGQLEGTALDPQGRVVLAPRLENFWGPDKGVVWGLASLPGGGVALAMSGPGRLVVVPDAEGEEIHHEVPDEGMVTALAVDAAGGVLFGLSPAGTVQRVVGDGDAVQLVETPAKFVWALAVDAAGDVWIGTGLPGGLWRARPGGELEEIYDSGDDPVRCITPLPGGGVIFGTGGEGRVIRVAADGELFVLFDADEKEVVAITVDDDGAIHVLTADSAKQVQSGTPPLPAGSMRVVARPANGEGNGNGNGNGDGGGNGNGNGNGDDPGAGPPPPPAVQQFRTGAGGALYRLEGGGARRLWETIEAMPFGMVRDGTAHLVATGDQGHLIRVDAEGRAAVLARLPSKQASGIARSGDGTLLVAGTTDARVAKLSTETVEEGSYRTPAIDAQRPADWGRVRWAAELPRGAALELRVRSGNTDEPDVTWSGWSTLDASGVGRVPTARWLQIEARLESGRGGSPALRLLEVDFVPGNRAPSIQTLEVQPPGVVWVHGAVQPANRLGPLVADDPVARGTAATLSRVRGVSPIRKGYETGARTVSWVAADMDGDRLVYALDIRREESDRWHAIADELTANFYSWDARSYPSGNYRVRLRVADRPDNTDGRDREAERASTVFTIDNDRPGVEALAATPGAAGLEVSFVAVDPGGRIRAAEIRMDAGKWRPLAPVDGIADSERESYRTVLGQVADSVSVQVRVTDAGGNLGGAFWGR